MKKLVFRSFLSPGDILMLTAAVRDLHRSLPNQYLTDVRTSCPQLWENNPYLTPLKEKSSNVEIIDCHYPLIHSSNQASHHFIQGYIDFLSQRLGKKIRPTAFKGDLHMSEIEKTAPSPVAKIVGREVPYWIIVAGGKFDYTIKWWHFRRYQAVVDWFRDRIAFVQIGERGHFHPELHDVIDLRGKTDTRKLVQLVYHAQGVLCPVTFLMHLSAAVPIKNKQLEARPCVVVAGGREPPQWEAYPSHQFIHTIGALPCCANGGCWRSRMVPLHDGSARDAMDALCVDVVNGLPHCMDLITPEEVVRRIELYFRAGRIRYLTSIEARAVRRFCKPSLPGRMNLAACRTSCS